MSVRGIVPQVGGIVPRPVTITVGGGGGGSPPVNSVLPVIVGTALVGSAVSCSSGTWTGAATITYAYQWYRDGVAIGGATTSSYTLIAADGTAGITCLVTATNGDGTAKAAALGVSVGIGPVFTSYPSISGSTDVGGVLTCSPGTATGSGSVSFAYQWQRDGADISGETAAAHTVVAADAATQLACVVTATDSDASADSFAFVHITRPLWHARAALNAGLGSPTLSDPSSISSSESLDANGTFTCTLAPSILANKPGTAVRYSQEVKSLGQSWTFGKLITILRALWETKPTAGTDVWVGAYISDIEDLTAGPKGFGVAMTVESTGVTRIRAIRASAAPTAGTLDASGTDSVITTITFYGDIAPDSTYRYQTVIGLDAAGGGLTNSETTQSSITGMRFQDGCWIHLLAGRLIGDGVAPNDASETVAFRGLVSLIGMDMSDRVGVAP